MPWLNCRECLSLRDDNPDLFTYPCELCPNRLLVDTGDVVVLACEVYGLMAANPLEQLPTWELLFEMVGITSPRLKRQVYELVCERITLEQEHREQDTNKDDRTWTNPNA
jgi:hypothetical protein